MLLLMLLFKLFFREFGNDDVGDVDAVEEFVLGIVVGADSGCCVDDGDGGGDDGIKPNFMSSSWTKFSAIKSNGKD